MAGRPKKWQSPEILEKLIDNYFKSISYEKPVIVKEFDRDENGNKIKGDNGKYISKETYVTNRLGEQMQEIIYVKQPTITGLALYLGTSRRVLMEYENNDEFSNTIKKAKTMIENTYEEGLMTKNSTGAIFALKNFDWTDKKQIETNDISEFFKNMGVFENQVCK